MSLISYLDTQPSVLSISNCFWRNVDTLDTLLIDRGSRERTILGFEVAPAMNVWPTIFLERDQYQTHLYGFWRLNVTLGLKIILAQYIIVIMNIPFDYIFWFSSDFDFSGYVYNSLWNCTLILNALRHYEFSVSINTGTLENDFLLSFILMCWNIYAIVISKYFNYLISYYVFCFQLNRFNRLHFITHSLIK